MADVRGMLIVEWYKTLVSESGVVCSQRLPHIILATILFCPGERMKNVSCSFPQKKILLYVVLNTAAKTHQEHIPSTYTHGTWLSLLKVGIRKHANQGRKHIRGYKLASKT